MSVRLNSITCCFLESFRFASLECRLIYVFQLLGIFRKVLDCVVVCHDGLLPLHLIDLVEGEIDDLIVLCVIRDHPTGAIRYDVAWLVLDDLVREWLEVLAHQREGGQLPV